MPIAAGQNVLQTLKLARDIASQAGCHAVVPSDILRALLADTTHPVHDLMRGLGLNLSSLHQELASARRPTGPGSSTDSWRN